MLVNLCDSLNEIPNKIGYFFFKKNKKVKILTNSNDAVILKDLSDAVINTNKTLLEKTIKNGLDEGIEPLEMIENGL